MTREQTLQTTIDAASAAYVARVADPDGKASTARIFDALRRGLDMQEAKPARLPACTHFAAAADPAQFTDPALRDLASALTQLEPHLTWRKRAGGGANASASYPDGHANAMLVGPGGLAQCDHVWLGLSLLAPHVRYPDHDHVPEETYLVLTHGDFCQEGNWFTPGVGGTFYNRPNILHAMRSHDAPLLAMWALWAD